MSSSHLSLSSPKFDCDGLEDGTPKKKRHSENKKSYLCRACCSSSSRLAVERDPSTAGLKLRMNNTSTHSACRITRSKEAEKYLPSLFDKEGIKLRIRDALSTQEWGLKYKYWTNNKSRMHVLENIGDFVQESGVEVGDSIHLYEDECKNLLISCHARNQYVSIHRHRARPVHVVEPSSTSYHQQNYTDTNTNTTIDNSNTKISANATSIYTPYAYNENRTDKDETSSTIVLQQQLKREEQLEETNNTVTLFTDPAPSYIKSKEVNNSNKYVTRQQQTSTHQLAMAEIFGSSSSSSPSTVKMSDDNLGDCYEGLGTLSEVHRFEFDFDDIMRDDKTL
ncbi:hypothetical protein ACLB2K_044968 [Fragaria x ananassa]